MANPNGNGVASGSVELDVKPPSNLVIPPPNVRETIAKTADFVARRGESHFNGLKQRVTTDPSAANNRNFVFVMEEDPYNAYFLWYLQQLKEGHGRSVGSAKQVVDNKPKGPPEPPRFRFSARMPNISAKDLEVLKLTALYTARVGENWLKDLRNPSSSSSDRLLSSTRSYLRKRRQSRRVSRSYNRTSRTGSMC